MVLRGIYKQIELMFSKFKKMKGPVILRVSDLFFLASPHCIQNFEEPLSPFPECLGTSALPSCQYPQVKLDFSVMTS